ncbi:DUF4215 domain-containing protein [Haliangium sp.]|uniref:DUF4215 domain-containing protein n=1 Tax=Haliangium sp. TaxID=2663208 RepID=UPI003D11C4AA
MSAGLALCMGGLCLMFLTSLPFLAASGCFDPSYPVGIPCSGRDTCPPGQTCSADGVCRADPAAEPRCGDGVLDPGEDCDDGNQASNDGCDSECRLEAEPDRCGNGVVDPGEGCDDGNQANGDGCDAECQLEAEPGRCGDGTVDPDEACDDGNQIEGDGCSADCISTEQCPNGIVDSINEEQCDTNGNSATCDVDCTFPDCGDGLLNRQARTAGPQGDQLEVCDSAGVDNAFCDSDCTAPECGDGHVNPQAGLGEQCDDGKQCVDGTACTDPSDCAGQDDDSCEPRGGDGCDSQCQNEQVLLCGNGQLDPGEEFDDPPGPSQTVPVDDQTCRFDFSAMTQLACGGPCNWGGNDGCDFGDADVFCKLALDNPDAVALSFEVVTALRQPGICCPIDEPGLECVGLGSLTSRGVDLPVFIQDFDLRVTHGALDVVTNVVCTDQAPASFPASTPGAGVAP